jgi:hypothetical protein
MKHCIAKIREIIAQKEGDRRSILQLGYNLGRLSELSGLGREPFRAPGTGIALTDERAVLIVPMRPPCFLFLKFALLRRVSAFRPMCANFKCAELWQESFLCAGAIRFFDEGGIKRVFCLPRRIICLQIVEGCDTIVP